MAVQSLRYHPTTRVPDEAKFGVVIYDGNPTDFHHWCFRSRMKVEMAEDGKKADIKRVLPVHAASDYKEAGFALGDKRIQNKKDKLIDMMALLYAWLDTSERTSVSSASTHLKRTMGDEEYTKVMKSIGFQHLVRAIRLFDNEFSVESGGYYFKKI